MEDTTEYPTTGDPVETEKRWGLKVPNIFVATFEIKGVGSSFNFRNTSNGDATKGYTLTFSGTTLNVKYGFGTVDSVETLTTATIPNLNAAYGKVYLTYEKQYFTVTIDGTRVLTYKDDVTRTPPEGEYANFFAGTGSPGFKNLKVVAGHLISDGTSNIAYVGGGKLDISGYLGVTSNTSILVGSDVVAEYTGPHDRPLRKYPEVAMTSASQDGYAVTRSNSREVSGYYAYEAFNGITNTTGDIWYTGDLSHYNTSDGSATETAPQLDSGSNTDRGEWIALEIPKPIKLDSFKLWRQNDWQHHHPVSATLYAKKTSSDSWTEIYRYDDIDVRQADAPGHFNVNSQVFYRFFAFVVRKRSGGASNGPTQGISIAELAFYGHEEGSGSLDTTLKSVYNVPATTGTQLEVYYDGQDYTEVPGSVADKTGNGHNGTIVGDGVGFDSTYKAFTFAGSDDYFHSTLDWSGDQVHSVSFWVKTTRENVRQTAVLLGTAAASGWQNHFSAFELMAGGNIKWYFGNNDIQYYADWIPNTWIHLAFSYIGGGSNSQFKSAYMNGRKLDVQSEPTTSTAVSFNSGDTVIRVGGGYFDTIEDDFVGSIANLRIYEKALNAGQVQELYDYQKDYFLGSKSQVTLYKGHLGVGVTEPSGQLELAGDERIQEYPPGPLTNYDTHIPGHGVFYVYASSDGANESAYLGWKAFNKIVDGLGWHDDGSPYTNGVYTGTRSLAGIKGEWIALKLPYAINLKSAATAPRSDANQYTVRGVGAGVILGSNDGNNWDQLHHFSGLTATDYKLTYINNINAPGYYTTFALLVTELAGADASLNISEIKFFGTPGPTTLDKGSLTLGRSLDVPRISRYDVDTETPRPEKLLVDLDTTVGGTGRGAIDISGRGNHLTPVNGGSFYSVADKAYSFDGSSGTKYEGAATGYLGGTNPFSISLWFNSTDSGRTLQTVVGLGNYSVSPNDTMTGIRIQNDGKVGVLHYNNNIITTSSSLFEFNSWNHVVYVFNGSTAVAEQKLYINGVNVEVTGSSHTGNALLTQANPNFSLGTWAIDNTNMFKGFISQPKLYNVALEPSEVKKLYNLGRTGRSMVISDTAVGIGKVPEAQLDVRGSARFAGNVDVKGIIKSTVPSWHMYNTNTIHTGTLNFTENMVTPQNCSVSLSTGRVTITTAGRYCVSFHAFTEHNVTAGTGCQIAIMKSGTTYVRNYHVQPVTGVATGPTVSSSHAATGGLTAIMDLAVNDYVEVNTNFLVHSNLGATFSGFMIG